jgi:hypothetical protein
MLVGHYGVTFAAKATDQRIPLGCCSSRFSSWTCSGCVRVPSSGCVPSSEGGESR